MPLLRFITVMLSLWAKIHHNFLLCLAWAHKTIAQLACTLIWPWLQSMQPVKTCHTFLKVPYLNAAFLVPSGRHHLSYDDCLEDKRGNYQNCSVPCCLWQMYTMIHTHTWAVLKDECWFRFSLVFMCLYRFSILCIFRFSSNYFGFFVVCFCYVGFIVFSTMSIDWLRRMSLKWHILCRMGRKTLTPSIDQFFVGISGCTKAWEAGSWFTFAWIMAIKYSLSVCVWMVTVMFVVYLHHAVMQKVTEEESRICWEKTTKAWRQMWRICSSAR